MRRARGLLVEHGVRLVGRGGQFAGWGAEAGETSAPIYKNAGEPVLKPRLFPSDFTFYHYG